MIFYSPQRCGFHDAKNQNEPNNINMNSPATSTGRPYVQLNEPNPTQRPLLFWPPFLMRLAERGLIGKPRYIRHRSTEKYAYLRDSILAMRDPQK